MLTNFNLQERHLLYFPNDDVQERAVEGTSFFGFFSLVGWAGAVWAGAKRAENMREAFIVAGRVGLEK